ncbi:MAG: hypothetical protein ACKVP7_19155 [Hyphomicrobiaceae bacterium]
MRKFIGISALATVAVAAASFGTLANPSKDLAGRWTGGGQITLSGGGSEAVKCIATYQVSNGGNGIRQALRCASSSYKIDAVANLTISGSSVSGDWEERTYSTTGGIGGRVTPGGYNLNISGPTFSAAMQVSASGCKQSIFITPKGFDISRISLSLSKC